jgi:hypothetical protein
MDGKSTHTLRIHLGLFAAEAICISAFIIEISRAVSGNTLSWAYVIEWPVLGGYAVYMWRKLLKDDGSGTSPTSATRPEDDAKLAAWNHYLEQVHSPDQSDQAPQ